MPIHAGITVVCAWCDKTMRSEGPVVSHGICSQCAAAFIGAAKKGDRVESPRPEPAR